jgi:hypothetical protein
MVGSILLQPLLPRRHELAGGGAALLEQMQHAPRPTATGTALRIAADHRLLIQETEGLLQHGLREAQMGVEATEIVHQRRGVAVRLQQAFKNPADRQLQAKVLQVRLLKEDPDGIQTRWCGRAAGCHRSGRDSHNLLAQSHLSFQGQKTILGFRV